MLRKCRAGKRLKNVCWKDHGDKRFNSYFTSKRTKKKNSHTSIPDLVKAIRNGTATDASAVNAELEKLQ